MKGIQFLFLILLISCQDSDNKSKVASEELSNDEILSRVAEAYIYGYPLLLMDLTKQASTNITAPHPTLPRAPINQLGHYRHFPDHTSRTVVKPNRDTYYSVAWLDLNTEPIIFEMPATDRYHVMQFMDAYTNVFLSLGPRTTGITGGKYMITGPAWSGEIPEDVQLFKAPTNMVWMIGRVQTYDDQDGATFVKNVQDQMELYPLSKYGIDGENDPKNEDSNWENTISPIDQLEEMNITEALNRMSELIAENNPSRNDFRALQRFKDIGFVPGKSFQLKNDGMILNYKIKHIPSVVSKRLRKRRSDPPKELMINNWMMATEGIGSYDTSYLTRAYVSFIGLGANLPEDAVYPNTNFDSNGDLLDGSKAYRIHMKASELPPIKGFWSITIYGGDEFLIPNSWNKFALGDRSDIQYNDDGSLDIYLQSSLPDIDYRSNWLPTTEKGPFSITMRLYWPEQSVLDNQWIPPSVVPHDEPL